MPYTGISAWHDLMTQAITIEPRAGQDIADTPVYGTPVSYRCRLVGKRTQVLNAAGENVVSNQTCYLGTRDPVDPMARVTLSTADVFSTSDNAIHPPILAVGRYPDENGAHHTALYF